MASTATSPSATSATSPPAHTSAPLSIASRPSLYMKPFPNAVSPPPNAVSPPASLTSKEWIVPPRPKPGRKPATDTPPTKRKAQNRAAQRAFRERRAARVGELEEQIKQVEDEYEQQQEELKLNITRLEQEVERYRTDLTTWVDRCRRLERELADIKLSAGQVALSKDPSPNVVEAEPVGCGNCTLETRCQCIDDAFDAMTGDGAEGDAPRLEKRATPTPSIQDNREEKRVKTERSDSMEIDFTALYAKPAAAASTAAAAAATTSKSQLALRSEEVADPCGFCQDGTPCICAEMAIEQEHTSNQSSSAPGTHQHRMHRQLAQFTPPPSEGDVTQTGLSATTGCASVPGTCAQCRADPNSTLFCKSLAASRSQHTTEPSGGCCGGRGTDGGCCQSQQPSRSTKLTASIDSRQLPPLAVTKPSVILTCADAYTTLSRHPAYERASGEVATWMPKLHATSSNTEGRPAMEIDAANVMSVLRDFDRRFGADR